MHIAFNFEHLKNINKKKFKISSFLLVCFIVSWFFFYEINKKMRHFKIHITKIYMKNEK